ncbi:hypothetical protein HN51_061519 [Arachis hypogaea]|uniref:Uncharacterized protein n=1 Tax=Arachis hypogaea TaxID=3818 RepID=A0A445ANI9_ARAHY|nr:uncharacterized protein LOC107618266 [Arachis ipaensis]XP_016175871.1 uncharacterized protein LOC107618266 [Arachis ipaensis]XP_025626777.1 uncharacterized protein LOC112720152 [Arachis hypogaea]XP_025626778.1 uncharacterized protein LOC112720152 [Arachis hypogaea]QHO18788.1 uncharacterized protein DS421_11g323520 [Arachis hypogaea]QHO18789.1 uncharacterized protein DS421_11g323520 [Arachis hypogaea]RYR28012.1 hypothetical protein Ahy_B01g052107 [Arachis hypogaea]
MYSTWPRSLLKKDVNALSEAPSSEGPNSGFLVLQDEAAQSYWFFGLLKNRNISHFPFPQSENLTVSYTVNRGGNGSTTDYDDVMFIPVLNQPLSSNRYYVIWRKGKHQGKACTSSKEEDMRTCLCFNFVKDVKPRPLDPFNEQQQFEIIKKSSGFHAKSVAPDGFPPLFLRRKGWTVEASTPKNYKLEEALGLNQLLRGQLPAFDFPLSNDSSGSVVIGNWYCPFMFVKEGMELKDQMKRSVFYTLTLEQRWEKILSMKNNSVYGSKGNDGVLVDVVVETEFAMVGGGKEADWGEGNGDDGVVWFSVGREVSVGLNLVIVERMKWEQERGGWLGRNKRQERIIRDEKFEGGIKWENFGCYVLVESFVLKRMDGSFVLTCGFRHTNQIMCKWE